MRVTGREAESPATDPLRVVTRELNLGIEVGQEPQAGFADDGASGMVTTRSSSWWNYRRCKTCGHTFRRGDRVLVDAVKRTVRHLAPGLGCGADPGPVAVTGGDRDEFAAGLLETWPSTVPLTRIEADDWRLPRPGDRWQAPTCLYCAHTFRAGEYVVVCPCQSDQGKPPACRTAVHRDPAAGLPCWDNWQPGGRLTICPTTTVKL
jgi:hypothetical protein